MKFESIIVLFGNALRDRCKQNVPRLEQLQKHGGVIPKGNNINSSLCQVVTLALHQKQQIMSPLKGAREMQLGMCLVLWT